MLLDTTSGLYVPQTYDCGFKGAVSMRTALAEVVNVPTVLPVGMEPFQSRQQDTGIRG